MKTYSRFFYLLLFLVATLPLKAQTWKNPNAKVEDRVQDLLSKMTLEEKISYCGSKIPEMERLGIPAFEWYGEALHGIIAWNCTQFPQNIAMGSTWNPDLMYDVATAISNEARALKNAGKKEVMMFSPTVNMARDPRWGRNGECYSEDPYLMSEMARMYVRGMQGNDPNYVKTVTTVKHYVANNVDKYREKIHSNINRKELYEYYFPAYKTCIVDEEATGIMTALNGLNGIPCSAHNWLVNGVLREEWGFEGYVIADWTAVEGIETRMHYAKSQAEAAAMAIKAGVDQECYRNKTKLAPMVYALDDAIKEGLMTEADLDVSVGRLLRLRFMTGDFDDPALNPYSKIPSSVLECEDHKKIALRAAEEAIVLLKNDNALPLQKSSDKLAVIGPFANRCWMGIYSGHPKSKVSPLDGIQKYLGSEVAYAEGCSVTGDKSDKEKIKEAVAVAKTSDKVILIVGNDEATSTENVDRKSLKLPGKQHELIQAVKEVNDNVILVLVPSGPTAIEWEQENLSGIVCAWPNGQEQGTALANVLFGDVNPSGKLNSTWYTSDKDLPDFHDYSIQSGRTYMYYKGEPLYPFGYGLSYTDFEIKNMKLNHKKLSVDGRLTVSVDVENTGGQEGKEVVQVYIRDLKSTQKTAQKALKGFKKVTLEKGKSTNINIIVPYEAFSYYDTTQNEYMVEAGKFEIMVGNASDNIVQKKTVFVEGGVIKPRKVGQKSAYYVSSDPNRFKKWDDLYEDTSFLYAKGSKSKKASGIVFKTVFNDPGFYVNTWDAEVNYELVSEVANIELQMLSNPIGTYKLKKSKGVNSSFSIKIPIPPEYGKEVTLNAIPQQGNVKIKSIKIIPPKGNKPYLIYPAKVVK
ncbi:glycoside hydrolase family 3 C-terminal domain-containing protein [Flammeovirga sp. EKP202]|uniref:glycoside hydrolase family 3 C-terminal domain-containing protein n=1 Tax=Flammeovirga sp. EKP202 TaxID=2770592 RepID=UPI00165F4D02|nr:glycoside hydrolase family 3 C-terminal domain-containing protein [Flammeovirga sp. EKP202]MBD0400657.1 glycoside hydrolase family 3 C-terminal domain-containing protein [Flammeovirga sp. EKP202]